MMRVQFHADSHPSPELLRAVAATAPANPFFTTAYAESRRALGFDPWMIALRRNEGFSAACPAFVKTGRLSRTLEIPSLPAFTNSEESGLFWSRLFDLCRRRGISTVTINSFASTHAAIPAFSGQARRRARSEYVLELGSAALWDRLASNHARNIRRGRQAGLQIRRAPDPSACREHAALVEMSLERRRRHGEVVRAHDEAESLAALSALTRCGAADVFQAVLDGRALSSLVVLRAARGAYYQSAGTSPEGMSRGASHWLVHEVANVLRGEGKELFNLGGAGDSDAGLKRFKTGFGTTTVPLEEAEFCLGGRVPARVRSGIGSIVRASEDLYARCVGFCSWL